MFIHFHSCYDSCHPFCSRLNIGRPTGGHGHVQCNQGSQADVPREAWSKVVRLMTWEVGLTLDPNVLKHGPGYPLVN